MQVALLEGWKDVQEKVRIVLENPALPCYNEQAKTGLQGRQAALCVGFLTLSVIRKNN